MDIVKKEKPIVDSKSVIKKSVLGIFTALIQHPKLAKSRLFNLINPDSKYSFMLDIRDIYIQHPNSAASLILEKIDQEKIKMIIN